MIVLDAVSKTFSGRRGAQVTALDRVDLTIASGEFVAVVGPSGSGKSSLLFTVGGLMHPTAGEVRLGEHALYDLDPGRRAALRRTEVGFVFQTFNLVPYLSCVENVAVPATFAGVAVPEAKQRARAMLERLGLSARAEHRPGELSVGERQRVAVARALVNGPRVLLADEPTGNLDPANADQVMSLFRDLHAGGQTIVMVTHDPRLAERAGRVVALDAGRVSEDRPGRGRRLAS
jgi:putative ABC transport system ATP-binding protein